MKTQLALLRTWMRLLSLFGSRFAGDRAIRLFMKTRKKKESSMEKDFYAQAHHFTAQWEGRDIHCYETGYHFGPLVLLVHGWESNAGSMAGIGSILTERGYHVISMDLPAHGRDEASHTNLYECKEALKAVIRRIRPSEPFSVIAHSFGSMVSAFALSEMDQAIDKLIYLTAPNSVDKIFKDYSALLKLNGDIHAHMVDFVESLLGEGIMDSNVHMRTGSIEHKDLYLFHDPNDKVIAYHESEWIASHFDHARLFDIGRTGHYRMLWHHNLLSSLEEIFDQASAKPREGEHLHEKQELLLAV